MKLNNKTNGTIQLWKSNIDERVDLNPGLNELSDELAVAFSNIIEDRVADDSLEVLEQLNEPAPAKVVAPVLEVLNEETVEEDAAPVEEGSEETASKSRKGRSK